MTIKEAYNITRPFYNRQRTMIPTLSNEWGLSDNMFLELLDIYNRASGELLCFSNKKHNKIFKDIKIKQRQQFEEHIFEYNIIGKYAFTSKGMIDEKEFNLAADIIDNLNKIKKKDLILNEVYMALNGKEYEYIGTKLKEVRTGKKILYKAILIYDEDYLN